MILPLDPRRPPGEAHPGGCVSFRLAGQWLGVPVAVVREVLTAQPVFPVPLAPPEVAGFLNLRGRIVTAVDLRARLGLPPRPDGAGTMNVVVLDGGELFALLVDEVGDVVEVECSRLEPAPPTLDARWRECCAGVARMERGLLVVVEAAELLRLPAAARSGERRAG